LTTTIAQCGHSVTVATNGPDAFALFLAGSYDVIISDYSMPGMTGVELCEKVRQTGGPYVYFLLITAYDEVSIRSETLNSSVDDFLLKPCSAAIIRMRLLIAERILRHQ
jgi:CheY-like chemotaxis protein